MITGTSLAEKDILIPAGPQRFGMQYAAGRPGRIFYIKFDHGEDLLSGLQSFIRTQAISSGIIHLIGAIGEGSLVAGSQEETIPPDQLWRDLTGVHDLIGTGMIRAGPDGPKVHFHASAGRGDSALTGCFRDGVRVYLLIEAVIIEFSGISVYEITDEKSGLPLPCLEKDKTPDQSR